GANHGADVPPVQHGPGLAPGGAGGEIALKMENGRPYLRHHGNEGGRLTGLCRADCLLVATGNIKRICGGKGCRLVGRVTAPRSNALANRPVERARIEIGEAVMSGEAARQRALAGGGRPVHRNDDALSARPFTHRSCPTIFAPRPRMRWVKSGKLVAIIAPSSIVTGFCAASPITRKDMAMR